MDINRHCAVVTLVQVDKDGAYSNLTLNKNIRAMKPSAPSFVRELVYGVLENRIYIDYILGRFIKTGVSKVDKTDINILRAGIYQLKFMDSVPEYAAIDESVTLSKKLCKGKDKFINGVLRNYLRDGDKIGLPNPEKNLSLHLSIKYSYHIDIVNLWLNEYGAGFTELLLKAGNETPRISARVNLLKTTKSEAKTQLELLGFVCEESADTPECLYIKGADITETTLFKEGMLYIQDESSMRAINMLNPQKGQDVIDMCAAPGGKTLFMAEKMKNQGRIIAKDIHQHKLDLMLKAAESHGIAIIHASVGDATVTDEELVETADIVLADVPCSGLGVVRRRPEMKYKPYDSIFAKLPELQLGILETSGRYVKPGGILMYCTCTISRSENQMVIEKFLQQNPNFMPVGMGNGQSQGAELKLYPHVDGIDGFYAYKMCKI